MATKPVQQEHLEAAWRALRRPAWPDTLAATMQDPARAHLLMGYARTLARRTHPMAPCPPPPRRAVAALSLPPGWVDHKRAAAGDRDDD